MSPSSANPDTAPDRTALLSRPWGRMAVHEWDGAAPAILFLHGNGCAAADWLHVRPFLPEPVRTFALDFAGHGASDAPHAPFFIGDLVEDVLAFIETRRLTRLVLAGHSLGGMVGIEVAARSPAVSALVLAEGWTSSAAWSAFLNRIHHFGALPESAVAAIKESGLAMQARVPPALRDPFWQSVVAFEGYDRLARLTIPVFELYGTAGMRADTQEKLRLPPNPRIRLHWIDNAGHFLLHERPDEVARFCREARTAGEPPC